jgi:hypothetical protein
MSEQDFLLGDLVYYIGPPIVGPLTWETIIENDNGIVSRDDLAIVIDIDYFLRIADLFFQRHERQIHRISFKHLKLVE